MSNPSRNKAGTPLVCSALKYYGTSQDREEPGILEASNPHFKTPKLNSKAAARSGRREPSRRGAVARRIIRVLPFWQPHLQEIWRRKARNSSAAGWSGSQGEMSDFFLCIPQCSLCKDKSTGHLRTNNKIDTGHCHLRYPICWETKH